MNNIQKKMFEEMKDESIFDLSKEYGFEYLSKAFERNVYPAEDSLKNLEVFEEELNEEFTSSNLLEIPIYGCGFEKET